MKIRGRNINLMKAQGNRAVLFRYVLVYEVSSHKGNPDEPQTMPMFVYCASEEELDRAKADMEEKGREYEIHPIDQSENEWLTDMVFPSLTEAVKAFEMGKEAYEQWVYDRDLELQMSQYATELDFRLLQLEWR